MIFTEGKKRKKEKGRAKHGDPHSETGSLAYGKVPDPVPVCSPAVGNGNAS